MVMLEKHQMHVVTIVMAQIAVRRSVTLREQFFQSSALRCVRPPPRPLAILLQRCGIQVPLPTLSAYDQSGRFKA
jgi:hypothetical protein